MMRSKSCSASSTRNEVAGMNKAISDRIRKTKKYRAIRESLLEQLRMQGAETAAFKDLVEDYMNLWVVKQITIIDIRQRGTVITYNNGGGQYGTKENPSIAYLLKLSSQMLKILNQLNLSVDNIAGGDGCDGL